MKCHLFLYHSEWYSYVPKFWIQNNKTFSKRTKLSSRSSNTRQIKPTWNSAGDSKFIAYTKCVRLSLLFWLFHCIQWSWVELLWICQMYRSFFLLLTNCPDKTVHAGGCRASFQLSASLRFRVVTVKRQQWNQNQQENAKICKIQSSPHYSKKKSVNRQMKK